MLCVRAVQGCITSQRRQKAHPEDVDPELRDVLLERQNGSSSGEPERLVVCCRRCNQFCWCCAAIKLCADTLGILCATGKQSPVRRMAVVAAVMAASGK